MAEPPASYTGIGLMSGTSTDGVDGVLAQFSPEGKPKLLCSHSIALPGELRQELLALNIGTTNELARSALAANSLAQEYAKVCHELLHKSGMTSAQVNAIGAHGQTVRHNPAAGYTCQLNAPALLAELTGINVVADFRTRDIAAGGQGAPLVPAFHAAVFAHDRPRVVLNLGGMANITVLVPGQPVRGFDTGPANVLLDLWCERHTGKAYDEDGEFAGKGAVNTELLRFLIDSEPWFSLAAPKSTGRDQFNAHWLDKRLTEWSTLAPYPTLGAADVQATLAALTAETVALAIRQAKASQADIVVCGGGALNPYLMERLANATNAPVSLTDDHGVPAQMVEALAFAWLAWAWNNNHPAALPEVTGARKPTILGCLYKA